MEPTRRPHVFYGASMIYDKQGCKIVDTIRSRFFFVDDGQPTLAVFGC